jgi:hypothetical protein
MALCYKDRTFCRSDCVNTECFRHWGKEQQEGARKWWSHDPGNAPVAFSDFSSKCEGYTRA